MSRTAVPPGHVAAIVTEFEMRTRPRPRPLPSSMLTLERWRCPALAAYRTLFERVGSRWLWFSRLVLSDDALAAIVHAEGVEVYAVLDRGVEVGMLELDLRGGGACEIAYFALVPELTGRGHGRWLMAHALALAWRPGVARVWLHSCTLDHPSAATFYRDQGFVAVARSVEVFADPRLTGHLPPDVAPQVALLS